MIITFTTDFGEADGYVGTVKGVVLGINPGATLVDLSHGVGAQNVAEGAFVLYRAYRFFPPDTVHIAVVDPGVGSSRRPLLLRTAHGTFVGPDNGLFSLVLRAELADALDLGFPGFDLPPAWVPGLQIATSSDKSGVPLAYELNNPDYWLSQISTTFHGRDIFGPSAAHVSTGIPAEELGAPVPLDQLVLLPGNDPQTDTYTVQGEVIHVDRFGNLITNIHAALLATLGDPDELHIQVGALEMRGLHETYADTSVGEPLALIGSEHLLEIGVRNGDAARRYGIAVGAAVKCSIKS